MPICEVLSYRDIESREKSGLHIDESCISMYENALLNTDAKIAEEALGAILKYMVDGNYSAQNCNDYLLKLMF